MKRHEVRVKISGTDLEISTLGLGTGPLGGMYETVTDKESDDLINFTLEQGINFFDTAPFYGFGRSEARLGRALRRGKRSYVLETKVGRVLNKDAEIRNNIFVDVEPGLAPVFDLSADGIKRSFEESLDRLGVDHIDSVLIHDAENYMEQAIDEAYPVLDEYRRQGVIKAVGIGMTRCAESIRFINECDLNIVLIAGRYTLLDQEAEQELFPLALKRNVSIIAAGVFNSGVLANPNPGAHFDYAPATDKVITRARGIASYLKALDIPLTAAALQFPLQHPAVTAILIGARNVIELRSNIEDFDRELPADIWKDICSIKSSFAL